MIITENSNFIEFKPKLYTREEAKAIPFIPRDKLEDMVYFQDQIYDGPEYTWRGITKIHGEYYFYKILDIDDNDMINELIGSYLAKKLKLRAVDYKLGISDGEVYALSKIFYNPGYRYTRCDELFDTVYMNEPYWLTIHNLDRLVCLEEEDNLSLITNPEMLENVLKLIVLDIKMRQEDRNDTDGNDVDRNDNLLLETSKESSKIDLAPIFDFGYSYNQDIMYGQIEYYENPFISMGINVSNLRVLMRKYPSMVNYIEIINGISMKDILADLQRENRIFFSKDEIEYYVSLDNQYSKVFKKSLSGRRV